MAEVPTINAAGYDKRQLSAFLAAKQTPKFNF
jgi:hypothetical protein